MQSARRSGATILVGVCAAIMLTACVPASDAVEPTATATPAPSAAVSTPVPAPTRPFQTIESSCQTIVSIGALEAAAGETLALGSSFVDNPIAESMRPTAVGNAGGVACTWSDAASGDLRASLTLVPEAVAADQRIRTEFAALSAMDPSPAVTLHDFCIYDYCAVKGMHGSTDVNFAIYGMPWSDSGDASPEIAALRDQIAGHLDALPAAKPRPALSEEWASGPTSCAEMLPAADLATVLGDESAQYSVGYAYEESNGFDVALLAADGFTCRFSGGYGGKIVVLPDAAAALAAIPPGADDRPVEVPGASAPGLVRCASNGEPFEAGTGHCALHFPIRGAWVMVLVASWNVTAEPLADEATLVAGAIVSALG